MHPNYSILPDLPESLESEIEEIEIQSTLKKAYKLNSVDSTNEALTSTSRDITINENSSNKINYSNTLISIK